MVRRNQAGKQLGRKTFEEKKEKENKPAVFVAHFLFLCLTHICHPRQKTSSCFVRPSFII